MTNEKQTKMFSFFAPLPPNVKSYVSILLYFFRSYIAPQMIKKLLCVFIIVFKNVIEICGT